MDKVRIAVAGSGSIGVRHIEEVQRSQGAVLSAIIDPSPKAIEAGQREDVPVYRSLPEFFTGHRPDGVVLATPNQMHVEQGLQMHRSTRAGVDRKADRPYA
jgi:predicted dehydrogenase